jgi:hypothetical protein
MRPSSIDPVQSKHALRYNLHHVKVVRVEHENWSLAYRRIRRAFFSPFADESLRSYASQDKHRRMLRQSYILRFSSIDTTILGMSENLSEWQRVEVGV